MRDLLSLLSFFLLLTSVFAQRPASPGRVELLQSIAGLAPDVVGQFRDPIGFQRAADGRSFVFDRRGHAVYRVVDGTSKKIVEIGGEDGRVIEPMSFDLDDDGTFVVADAPNGRERLCPRTFLIRLRAMRRCCLFPVSWIRLRHHG